MVVSIRPIREARVDLVRDLSARYPHAHDHPRARADVRDRSASRGRPL